MKGNELGEFRIFTSSEGLNSMIGDLQLLVSQLQQFEQLSAGINSLIETAKTKNETKEGGV